MPKKKKKKGEEQARVHPDLIGFSIEVDAFGNIRMNRTVEEMSEFLQTHLSPSEEEQEALKKGEEEE